MQLLKRIFNTQQKTTALVPLQVVCNYRDNYYGDQVCRCETPGQN